MRRGSEEIPDSVIHILEDHHQTAFIPTSSGEIMRPCDVWVPSVSNFVSYSRAIINLQTSKMFRPWSPVNPKYFQALGLQTSVGVEDLINQLKGLAVEDVKKKVHLKPMIEMNLEKLAEFDTNEDDLQGM